MTGIPTLVSVGQCSNAPAPMLVTPLGNRVTSPQAPWIFNERGLAFVEQHSIHAAIKQIICIHGYCCEAGAVGERVIPDAGDADGDGGVRQLGAFVERVSPNADDVSGNRHAGQSGAVRERVIADVGDAGGNANAGQVGAAREHRIPDPGDAIGDGGICQRGAFVERSSPDAGDVTGNR